MVVLYLQTISRKNSHSNRYYHIYLFLIDFSCPGKFPLIQLIAWFSPLWSSHILFHFLLDLLCKVETVLQSVWQLFLLSSKETAL